ncbi:MFS transporter [uncultured Algibacter sp.]|uniref:MFS transporter n=1 Tax=uncultured Algibacter sp. TaxID=298659 RepID=UPI002608AF8C|nr:MFS transporter [uncultured Algibacter sp.]
MGHKKLVLPLIIISQFCCTSLWFAGNAVIEDLIISFKLDFSALGHLTSAVQLGFIFGTLLFAILTITDRFSPSKVFFYSAIIASIFNILIVFDGQNLSNLILFRFLTGFFLAGIYPVGMKIASDYYKAGLGKSLGLLVGALALGTAFPHLLKGSFNDIISWKGMILTTSLLAIIGGVLIRLFVPNGPYRKSLKRFDISVSYKVFRDSKFRSAAFGYFGHMWELYAFWAFIPVLLSAYTKIHPDIKYNIPLLSFVIIAFGGVACVISGYLSQKFHSKGIATASLFLSCTCCLLSPIIFQIHSELILILFLIFWGMVVIADSPLFSTLVAQSANENFKGTALTIVNCIGFTITIFSIQILNNLMVFVNEKYLFLFLAIGPVFGLFFLLRKTKVSSLD